MENERNIKRYSADELRAKRAKGESKTDFAALALKTDEQIESENASDDEFQGVPEDWHEMAEAVMPASKQLLSLRLDKEVVEWFRARGPGYQTRMNAVLRAFVMHEEKDKSALRGSGAAVRASLGHGRHPAWQCRHPDGPSLP